MTDNFECCLHRNASKWKGAENLLARQTWLWPLLARILPHLQ